MSTLKTARKIAKKVLRDFQRENGNVRRPSIPAVQPHRDRKNDYVRKGKHPKKDSAAQQ